MIITLHSCPILFINVTETDLNRVELRTIEMFLRPHLLVFLCFWPVANCWTTEDMELFDLVESTPQTFYQVLGVGEKASQTEIRKAYRKLSTLLHPDRNRNWNAEEEFRKVAAVADVLRNEEKRKQYDVILLMGLPDWRTPIYYYRRARNMGLFQLGAFLFCLATLFQYIYAWAAYWEKRYEMEEIVISRIRKKAKHQRKGNSARVEEEVSEAMSILQKPRCQDLFPVRLFHFVIHFIKSSPAYVASCRNYIKLGKSTPKEEKYKESPVPRMKSRKVAKTAYSTLPSYKTSSNGISTLQNDHKPMKGVDAVKQLKSQSSKTASLSMQGANGTENENFYEDILDSVEAPIHIPIRVGTKNSVHWRCMLG